MKFLMLLVSMLMLSCSDNDCCVNIETGCYSFDIRQCQTDGFADAVDIGGSVEARERTMKTWLESQNFEVVDIKLTEGFHEAVCEACDVCPQGDRYFVKIVEIDTVLGLAEELRLLSFEKTDCSTFG